MTSDQFAGLRAFLRGKTGLFLQPEKDYLIESRLAPIARRAGFSSVSEFARQLPRSPAIADEIADAMATGETSFFRDKQPFEVLRDHILPPLIAARASSRVLRIWCAASASGQEPYSLAMLLRSMQERFAGWRVDFVATDLVAANVERARQGVYTQFEVQRGLPVQLLLEHFTRSGDSWQIAPDIRHMVRFSRFNLLDDFAVFGKFDLILCRNVLMYFDTATKTDVLQRLARALKPDAALLLGGAETTLGLTKCFVPHSASRMFLTPAAPGYAASLGSAATGA